MKVLHVITSLRMGGAEKLMVDLLPLLNSDGCECDLLTFDGSKTPFRSALEASGVKIFDFGRKTSAYSLKNLFRLIPLMRNYDIVHTHNTAPQLFAAIGSVLCSVGLCTTEHTTSNRRRDWRWYAPVDRWMYSRYKAVISISDKTEEKLLEYIPNLPTRHEIVYNGIPVDVYANAGPSEEIGRKFPDTIKIFMVAGFRYQKDQPTVIKAMKHLPEKCHLFLVGDGVERQKSEKITAELNLTDRVHFLGRRSDVPQLLKTADVCVISSHWEGFGLAAVEGMAAGVPVVASDIPGVAEVVKGAGVLFEQGNHVALADEINRLLTDKTHYSAIVASGLARARQFDISKMAQGYLKVYKEIYE